MKKITLLTLLLITGLAFGQEIIIDGGLESIADSNATNGTTIVQGSPADTDDGVWYNPTNVDGILSHTATGGVAGSSALILDNTTINSNNGNPLASKLQQNLTLTPNTSYLLTYKAKLENSNVNNDQNGDITADKSLTVQLKYANLKHVCVKGTNGILHSDAWKTRRTDFLSTSEFKTISVEFSVGDNGDSFLAFALQGDATGSRVIIDEVSLTAGVLSNKEFKADNNFSFAPNPTNNFVNLSASKNIEKVEFYNLLGQIALSAPVNGLRKEVNISNLKSGIYLMKVTIDNAVGTYKIIKK
jgi:hypothetical protein